MRLLHIKQLQRWILCSLILCSASTLHARGCGFAFDFREDYDDDAAIPREVNAQAFHSDSFAARFPGVAEKIASIEEQMPNIRKEFSENPQLTPRQMFDRIVRYRQQQAEMLLDLANTIRDPVFVKALQRAAQVMRISPRSLAKIEEALNRNIRLKKGGFKAFGDFTLSQPLSNRDYLFFQSYLSAVLGISGELQAFIRLPGVVAFGVTVRSLLPDAKAKMLHAGIEPAEVDRLLDKEIDVVYAYGSSWAEVKNRRLDQKTLETRIGSRTVFDKISKQALDNVKLLKVLNLTNQIELHEIFVNGIDENAADFLRDFDIIVESLDPAA